ncbi:uncharacterized protein [Antedon mediterranea]|uniref:uncharacterized protein n=1 Tax=Antedon mediterranea TaxID=105859 RepID=UPI003AF78B5A
MDSKSVAPFSSNNIVATILDDLIRVVVVNNRPTCCRRDIKSSSNGNMILEAIEPIAISTSVPKSITIGTSADTTYLLQRRFNLADYFSTLGKPIDVKKMDGIDSKGDGNTTGLKKIVCDNEINHLKTETKTEKTTDNFDDNAEPQTRFKLLKSARRKIRKIFQKDRQACKYLDDYKKIDEENLKPISNPQDSTPSCLGFGSFGVVNLMTLTEGDKKKLVAIKSFPYEDSFSRKKKRKMNKKITKELQFMDRLREIPEFPDVYGVCKNQNGYHIVMEFIGNKKNKQSQTLSDEFEAQYNDGFPYTSRKRDIMWMNVLLDIVKGIRKMHEKDILHCDISPRNVLLYKKEQRVAAKVIDVGLACNANAPRWLSLGRLRPKSTAQQILNDNKCVAPEFANGNCWRRGGYFSKASDVWSIGQIFNGISPLFTACCEEKLETLFRECTTENPAIRATAEEIQSNLESIILRLQMDYIKCM